MLPSTNSHTPPTKTGGPEHAWPHRKLYKNIIKTLYALPEEFRTSLRISDFRATDIFTLNSALGASIESALRRYNDIGKGEKVALIESFERIVSVLKGEKG